MVAKCKKKLIIANYSAKSNHNEVMLFLEGRLIRPRTVKNVLGVLSQDGEKGIDIQIGKAVILADSAWRRGLRKLILLVQARFADRC